MSYDQMTTSISSSSSTGDSSDVEGVVGYRFHPTNEELVDHYLWNKILGHHSLVQPIKEVAGICNKDPWLLPSLSEMKSGDQAWYFFSRRRKDMKRVKRTTENGFWKVTGKTRKVKGKRGSAVKKILVFHEGRFPNAKRTPWVMHEYSFTSNLLHNNMTASISSTGDSSDVVGVVGYRFHPTNEELVDHYLWNKILGQNVLVQPIKEVAGNICNKDPWLLPSFSEVKSGDQVWYFFSRRRKDMKRVKRTTDNGFWKVTGTARNVKGKRGNAIKKTLVFYEGRSPNAKWTPWVMHEYTFTSNLLHNNEGIFLCKLKKKEDRKDDTSTSKVCEPLDQVIEDGGILDNSNVFELDHMLATATLEELDLSRDGADNNFSPQTQLLIHEEQVPLHDLSGDHIDESWKQYLVEEDEVYPSDTNQHIVENEGCSLLSVAMMTCHGKFSKKRPRSGNGEMYEQAAGASCLLDEQAGSRKFQAMKMVNAPNGTSIAREDDCLGMERTLSIHIDSADLHYIFHVALAESVTKQGMCSGSFIISLEKRSLINLVHCQYILSVHFYESISLNSSNRS